MDRQQKELVVNNLRQDFQGSTASFLVKYQGLSVGQMQALRKGLKGQDGELKVTKARLMRLAADGVSGVQDMIPYFKDQVGLVFARGESSAVAKVLYDFEKEHAPLVLIVGTMEEQLLDAGAIKALALLPPREVLLAQLCGTLQAPISTTVRLLNLLIVRLLVVMKKIAEQK